MYDDYEMNAIVSSFKLLMDKEFNGIIHGSVGKVSKITTTTTTRLLTD